MTIEIDSTSDSKEAAALGDLANTAESTEETKTEVEAKTDETSVEGETTEEGEPSETETDDESEELETKIEDETQEDQKPKKKGGFQKKLEKKDKQISALEQEREYWRQEALRTQKAPDKIEVETAAPVKESLRPKVADFASHDEYLEALVDWKADQKLQAVRQKENEEKLKAEGRTKVDTYRARAIAFAKTHDDFDDALNSVKTPMSPAVNQAILESEHGPEIAYALAKDQKEFERICKLPYGTAMRELGRLEAKFSKSTESKSSVTTTTMKAAPKPVTTIRTRGAATTKDINDPEINQREFERRREEQIKQNSMRR